MNDIPISMRISETDKRAFDQSAREKGMTLSVHFREGNQLLAGIDKFTYEKILQVSTRTRVDKTLILNNVIINWLAKNEAYKDVYGQDLPDLEVFLIKFSGPVPGQALFESAKRLYLREFMDDFRQYIEQKKSDGKPLNNSEKAFLGEGENKDRLAWVAAHERAREAGAVPANVRLPGKFIGLLWLECEKGNLTRAEFDEELKGQEPDPTWTSDITPQE